MSISVSLKRSEVILACVIAGVSGVIGIAVQAGTDALGCSTPGPIVASDVMPLTSELPESCLAANTPEPEAPPPLQAEASLEIPVEAWDLYFAPDELRLPAEGTTRLHMTNNGYVVHNLTVDELALELVVGRGGSDEVTVVDPLPGRYVFYCSVSGHREAGMEGVLIVE